MDGDNWVMLFIAILLYGAIIGVVLSAYKLRGDRD